MQWHEIEGWFQWRSAQEEAVRWFPQGSCFVEVGTYLGRSLCSLADVVRYSGKTIALIGIDTCRGSGSEGPRNRDYHGAAGQRGRGTFAGELHRNIIDCGYDDWYRSSSPILPWRHGSFLTRPLTGSILTPVTIFRA